MFKSILRMAYLLPFLKTAVMFVVSKLMETQIKTTITKDNLLKY